jgi:hypothetical protein
MRPPLFSRPRFCFAAAIVFATVVATAIGACGPVPNFYACASPGVNERGADGGPDPCHCDPPPSSNYEACGCLSDPSDQASVQQYDECMLVYREELEGGVGGGI